MTMNDTDCVRVGWLERDEVRLIPDELHPEFNVAVDARGATDDEWDDWRLMYCRAARRYDFSSVNGYNGMNVCQFSLAAKVKKLKMFLMGKK